MFFSRWVIVQQVQHGVQVKNREYAEGQKQESKGK